MSGRILVVDDVATNRLVLEAKLSAAYYDVVQAEDGLDALEKAEQKQPDLIILDVMMPGIDGFETCNRLRASEKTAHVPVIMVTSLNRPDDRLHGLKCGANEFLSRPISDLALFSRVRNLLRSKFMLDELSVRDRTTQEFGLPHMLEPLDETAAPPARVALVPPDVETGQNWVAMLETKTDYDLHVYSSDEAEELAAGSDLPDAYIVHLRPDGGCDGLRLVSYLRSRPWSRNSSVVLVVPEGDQEHASKGLDLGASDYMFENTDPVEFVLRLDNIVRAKRLSDRLRENLADSVRLAVLDPLTGLFNRRYARQHLARVTARASETGKSFALMLLDIDHFKAVNDTHGHAAGDEVLKEFSLRIRENLRGIDLVSRIGGEEFLVAMPDTSKAQACTASERLRSVIDKTPFTISGPDPSLKITVSIGVTMGAPGTVDFDRLLAEADGALYESKNDGRNTVTLFTSAA